MRQNCSLVFHKQTRSGGHLSTEQEKELKYSLSHKTTKCNKLKILKLPSYLTAGDVVCWGVGRVPSLSEIKPALVFRYSDCVAV